MGDVRLILGDCLQEMATLRAASVHAIVTDPPYGLKFMGKNWDHGVPGVPFWAAALRVLKPGHYMLCFGGTRTYHRLACAIEDAGWEIRDCLMWVYGSGFPKGKGCLKPAWEPILLARKPGPKVLPLQIDACRIGCSDMLSTPQSDPHRRGSGAGEYCIATRDTEKMHQSQRESIERTMKLGRWPANVIHDGSEEVVEGFPNVKVPGPYIQKTTSAGYGTNTLGNVPGMLSSHYGDSGSAARFFYCAKASRADRNDGLDGMPAKQSVDDDWISESRKDAPGGGKPSPQANHHPTVKPTALMRYLCRLITPPGGKILDPFCGSGSTGKAARMEGFDFVGIEKEAEYHAIAQRRIAAAQAETPLFAEAK